MAIEINGPDTEGGPGSPNQPGRRTGEGSQTLWEHLRRDERRKSPRWPVPQPAPDEPARNDHLPEQQK
jgi:hypothetical protein